VPVRPPVGRVFYVSSYDLQTRKSFPFDEGDTVAEVVVLRRFKAKFDDNGKPLIPEVK
jgi:hypothetical protein